MNFGKALLALQRRRPVARRAWGGQFHLRLSEPGQFRLDNGQIVAGARQFGLFSEDGVMEWLDNPPETLSNDILADDWEILQD